MNWKFLLPLLLSSSAQAQIQLKANDPLIRYDLIRQGHYYSKGAAFDSMGHITFEFLSEHVVKADSLKKEFLFVRYSPSAVAGRIVIDSCWNDANGPVRYVLASYPSTRSEADVFYPTEVRSHMTRRGFVPDTTVRMTQGYLDDTSIWELFGYMDLQKGVKYDINVFGSDKRIPLTYHIEYAMDDYSRSTNGAWVHSRVVTVRYGEEAWSLWIDPQTRNTLRAVMRTNASMLVITLI
jgi:hypothetical protein